MLQYFNLISKRKSARLLDANGKALQDQFLTNVYIKRHEWRQMIIKKLPDENDYS